MDINIKIDMPALDRFVDAIVAGAGIPASTPKPTPAPTATAKKVEAKAADEPKPETVDGAATEDNTQGLRDAAKAAALALQQKNGREALIALLAEFGAANITAIPVEKLQSFADAAKSKAA